MKTSALAVGLSAALLCAWPASAQSTDNDSINPDRPGIADGSNVVGRGRVQFEAGVQLEFRDVDGQTQHTRYVPTLVRAGLGDRWEARVEGNTVTSVDASGAAGGSTDFAPISGGLKFHIQDSDGIRKPSLGAIARIFPVSGSGDLHTTHTTGDVRFVADWDLTSALSLNPNAGVALYEDEQGARFTAGLFALTLNYFNAAKTFNPFIDVGVQSPEAPAAASSVIVDGGLGYIIGRNVQLDVSAGRGVHGNTPPRPFVAVGVSFRFQGSSKRP